MINRRMATQAISDNDLLKLLIADKYQSPTDDPAMGIDAEIYMDALSRQRGSLDPIETEEEIKELYMQLLESGIDPSQLGAIEHGPNDMKYL